jgi:hypothetical protein
MLEAPRSPPSDETGTDPDFASGNVLRLGFRILVSTNAKQPMAVYIVVSHLPS